MESMDDYKEELEASFRRIREGDILTGTVIDVNEEGVTLDLKYYAPGFISAEEMSSDPDFSLAEAVHVGDTIEATVIRVDDGAGNILLSRREANEEQAWEKLKGIRAFIPASQITSAYVEDTESWVGKEIPVRVITVDEEREKLVLSGKAVALEAEAEERNHKISMIVPGTVLEGTVESLMPYGAFIDLGNGLSGLVHISQICERRIGKPSEVLKVGEKVKAKVLNTNDNKISLSMKALAEEMVDTEGVEDLEAYTDHTSTGTSLGSLLAGLKLD